MKYPCGLEFVPDHLKMQEMCDKAVRDDPSYLVCVPDWFVRQQQVNMWYDDYYNDGDYDEIIKWHNGHKKGRPRRHKFRKNFCPLLGVHQDGGIGVFQKTRKKRQKNCGSNKELFLTT